MRICSRKGAVALALIAMSVTFLAASAQATIHQISVSNNQFSPNNVQIAHGDTVRWVRQAGSTSHTTTSDLSSPKEWDSQTLAIGVPFDVQFTASDGNGPFTYHCDFHAAMKGTITVQTLAVEVNQSSPLPAEFSLEQNYPNPFNPSTSIGFSLERSAEVDFSVYNIIGEQVESKALGQLAAGKYTIVWDSNASGNAPLSSGVYFYRLQAGDQLQTRKMVLLK